MTAMTSMNYHHDTANVTTLAENCSLLKNGGDMEYTIDMAKASKALIGAALQKRVHAVDTDSCEAGEEDAFFVADVGEVYRQHMRWKKQLPRITPHFAVKCNPDPMVLRLLAALGSGFDCASKAEIEQVLAIGVDASRIIYAQPCKTKSYLRYTAAQNVRQMTFDNTDELHKIAAIFPAAECYLRILTDDSASLCRLSQKFGASLDAVPDLLHTAKKLGLNIAGVAFHVGSGASDPSAFLKAVQDARSVFDQAIALGFAPHTLDCGGGFVSETFDMMSGVLAKAVDTYFEPTVRIIAEPGRYYTSAAFTIACNVIARRTVVDPETNEKSYMLYLNDGVYGNFSSIMFDHQHPVPRVLRTQYRADGFNYSCEPSIDSGYTSAEEGETTTLHDDRNGVKPIEYSIWGPTCDGIDCISAQWFSRDLINIGDWLFFEDMGAYTKCSATRFNGFPDKHDVIYVCSEPAAATLLGMSATTDGDCT